MPGAGLAVGVVTVVHHAEDARILQRQIRALQAAGAVVTYAAPWSDSGSAPPAGVIAVDLPRAAGRGRLPAWRAARRVLRWLAAACDVVLLHDPELVPLAAGVGPAPVVWDVHEDTAAALGDKPWLPAAARPLAAALVRTLERGAERRVHLLLAEDAYAARFRRSHPVVPNDPPVPERVAPPGADRVVYVGRLSEGRGAAELLALAGHLPPGVTLHLIGPADAAVRGPLEAAVRAGRLRWHGFLPNPAALDLVEGAAAGLSLLRDEPNYRHSRPTKVVEYMARGVPVVTTPNPLGAALVRRHGCGVVTGFRDVPAAAAAVRDLVGDPVLRERMGRAGHAAALAHHDGRASGAAFVAHLDGLARRGRP